MDEARAEADERRTARTKGRDVKPLQFSVSAMISGA